jgi:hypothetical protein
MVHTRKKITMQLTVSVPIDMTADDARREVRTRINELSAYFFDDEGEVKVVKLGPAPAPYHRETYLRQNEIDTVLASLRCYQQVYDTCAGDMPDELLKIATNGGLHEPPTLEEIDALCERINT